MLFPLTIIVYIIDKFLALAELMIFVNAICSWIIRDPFNNFMNTFNKICDPFLKPFRLILNKISIFRDIPVDLSPVFFLIVCSLLRKLLWAIVI